jgi:hypothetical protein
MSGCLLALCVHNCKLGSTHSATALGLLSDVFMLLLPLLLLLLFLLLLPAG